MRTKVKMLLAYFRPLGKSSTVIEYELEKRETNDLIVYTPKGTFNLTTSLKNVIFDLVDENFDELYRDVHTEPSEYWTVQISIDPTLNQIILSPHHEVEIKEIIEKELNVTDLPERAKRFYDAIYEGEYGSIIDFTMFGHFGHAEIRNVEHNNRRLRLDFDEENNYFQLGRAILNLIIGDNWIDDYGAYAEIRLWDGDIIVYIEQEDVVFKSTGFEKIITE